MLLKDTSNCAKIVKHVLKLLTALEAESHRTARVILLDMFIAGGGSADTDFEPRNSRLHSARIA